MKTLLEKFHSAILTRGTEDMLPALTPPARMSAGERMGIYIDGYRLRLVGAIRADYPALLALLGEDAFDACTGGYIEKNPPKHFSLDRYPHAFAAFAHEHLNDTFAVEVAALEAAIAEVFIMEESDPLEASALAGLTPEDFGALVLKPRAASRLLSFEYPVNDWLNGQRSDGTIDRPAPAETYLYVYRHQNNVQRAPLERAAYLLLERLGKGLPVARAFEYLEKNYPEHIDAIAANLQAWFAEWMEKGFFRK